MFYSATVGFGKEAGITSQNIVGYQDLGTEGAESPSIGMTFLPINGGETFRLGSVTVKEMDPDADCLQLLDSETTALLGSYSYFSKELADILAEDEGEEPGAYDDLIGWWDIGMAGEADNNRDNETISIGQGFLGLMASHAEMAFVANGEVPQVATSISTDGAESPYVCNYLPVNLLLRDITATDMDPDADCLQLLDNETTGLIGSYSYFSKELADILAEDEGEEPGAYDNLIGWWDIGMAGEPENYRGEEPLKAGQAFLGLMASHADISFNFPSATDYPSLSK